MTPSLRPRNIRRESRPTMRNWRSNFRPNVSSSMDSSERTRKAISSSLRRRSIRSRRMSRVCWRNISVAALFTTSSETGFSRSTECSYPLCRRATSMLMPYRSFDHWNSRIPRRCLSRCVPCCKDSLLLTATWKAMS